ncbi:MAG: hypothetical protein NVS3B20_18400 [Polyangiales bacterium]
MINVAPRIGKKHGSDRSLCAYRDPARRSLMTRMAIALRPRNGQHMWGIALLASILGAACRRPAVTSDTAVLASNCSMAATTYIWLRGLALEYSQREDESRAEAEKRAAATESDLSLCVVGAPRQACCQACQRVKSRVGGRGFVAICDDFFDDMRAQGCGDRH